MDDASLHLVRAKLLERGVDRLHGALHVALDDEQKLLLPALRRLLHHLFERAGSSANRSHIAELADAVLGQFPGAGFAIDHGELIACLGRAIETPEPPQAWMAPR